MTTVYGTGAYDFKRHRVAEYPLESTTLPNSSITLSEIQHDRLTKIAEESWTRTGGGKPFDPEVVKEIYAAELKVAGGGGGRKSVPLQRVMVLEVSQYLENYLWPNFDPEAASFEHVMSMILMINEKFRENVAAWICFHDREDLFKKFLQKVLRLKEGRELTIAEKTNYLVFMINAFQSLEDGVVNETVLSLAGLQSWHSLSYGRFQMELCLQPDLIKKWKRSSKKWAAEAMSKGEQFDPSSSPEANFVQGLIEEFVEVLDHGVFAEEVDDTAVSQLVDDSSVLYCERFMEFLIDMLNQLPTRRYLRPLVADIAVVAKCRLSFLYKHEKGKLFAQLVDLLQFYEKFEIKDHDGTQLTDDEALQFHYDRFMAFQLRAFKKIPKLRDVSLANIGSVHKSSDFRRRLSALSLEDLRDVVCSKVSFVNADGAEVLDPRPPFRITLPKTLKGNANALSGNKISEVDPAENVDMVDVSPKEKLIVEAYTPPDPGPYPQDQPKQNSVKFTPTQVGAIISGIQPGLTMVVGPPGTGKTDTAVHILNVLYHNCPSQRTLIITHSNQALNDLFEKIMERDVPARYLLRLGQGEQELATDLDFSRQGRVNAMLVRRLELLSEVERLARSLQLPEDVGYTCETAGYFWLLHVYSRWELFLAACAGNENNPSFVQDRFPFKEFFSDAPKPVFSGESFEKDMRAAKGCFTHLKTVFQELEECRAFELLKSTADRANYLMTKQAKIVAMTCTHAALKRRDFLKLGFKYDNLLMEESAQILEIETFIPMLLQRQEDGHSRLKRSILIGDHHQLPPVVKNMAFQKYSHMDQSLFTRFVRLGIPYIELNAQGRARPSLAKLYN
uniref:Intron-binding protein aquarius N-terminal domain-containing protein n=1 Tax=Brassica campestris TaxID=3711 RepID=A0A3P6C9V1_BRACM|nr:unnamed protein product [Brassica rapa]